LPNDCESQRAFVALPLEPPGFIHGVLQSHAKGDVVKGINILTCMVRYGDFSLPLGYEIIKKDVAYCDIETKKMHRKSSTTKN
jgi:hypothetical protein